MWEGMAGHGGHGFGWGWPMGGFLSLLLLIVVVAVVVALVRQAGGRTGREPDDSADRAESILRERYARGEIDEAEFEHRRHALKH